MGIEFLTDYMLPVIVGICLCIGYVLKKWVKDLDNKYIPTMCASLGVVLACCINGWKCNPDVILQGLFSGLAATGMHQAFVQLIKGGDKDGSDNS